MLVSTKGRYALRAVVDIAENSLAGRVSLRSVAQRQGISDKYLEAIVKPLVLAGVLTSVRGKNGGYQLAKPASEITAGDVIRAVEGEVASAPCCEADGEFCDRLSSCRTARFWSGLEQAVDHYLDSRTIAELAIPDLAGNDYVI
ncbi:RrF2 family transcriptional regulator [Anaerotardibacter muris]|uniref:RrF2 family transcriptional regulator n=1 Tax=Anaerotardibacter muris TaxID=2941505 RepID=UPI00203FE61D|nr:Rrf2 family transcriptional regulator [Anaerotardibacter muris]